MSVPYPTTDVEYREVPRFVGYCFGADGSVWSAWRQVGRGIGNGKGGGKAILGGPWHLVSQVWSSRGYLAVNLKSADRERPGLYFVHRLILEAFVGPCPPGMEACHFPDPNRTNNRIKNLRWDTPANNQADRVIHGTSNRGEQHPMAKLTREDAIEVRRLRQQGMYLKDIAERFGVARTTISDICQNRTWPSE